MIEVTVKVSDSEQKLISKFLEEEGFCISHDDPTIRKMVDQAIANFKGKPEDVAITLKADW